LAAPVKYNMTTEIPAGIASPAKAEIRLGTLKFNDGFPDDATGKWGGVPLQLPS